MRQRVLLASNRGPFSYWFGAEGTLIGRRGGGGLISGMTPGVAAVAAQAEVIWICAAFTDADRAAAHQWGAGPEDPADPPGTLGTRGTRIAGDVPVRMLDIPRDTFHRAYNNVANSTLWFVHHMLFDTPYQPVFGREFRRDWESYLAYNQAFADALAEEALAEGTRRGQALPAGTCALIQDYHLSLAPRLLRERLGDTARGIGVAHLSHTPWAPPRYYRLLPREVGRALLDGMLDADHLGFHAEWWAAAFLDCCEAILGADVSRPGPADAVGRVVHRGHVTEVDVHPLGVDAPALRARAAASDVQAYVAAINQVARGRKLIVRVDRTELSKNIVRGLAAYRELLAAVVWGWGVAQYPVLLPGTAVTLSNAGAPDSTLTAIVVLFIVAVLLIGPSFALLFTLQNRRLLQASGPGTSTASIPARQTEPPASPPRTAQHPGTRAAVLALIILDALIRRRRHR